MEMCSLFICQEIEVLDKKKLQDIKDNKALCLYGLIDDDLDVNFWCWGGHKLYDYWYPETIVVLKELAKCIQGYVEFYFEGGFPFRIYFENGEVYLKHPGKMIWDKFMKEEINREF